MRPLLCTGNPNYSSWSLRAWLALAWSGLAFDERRVELDQPGYGERRIAEVLALSPSGLVPVLHVDGGVVWDSLAIAEWAAEAAPAAALMPAQALARARVRSVMAEMHAGFQALRQELPMNIRRRCVARALSAAAEADVARIEALWCGLRREHAAQGPWLFGRRSLADAFHLPLATRFRTYALPLAPEAAAYRDTLLADADFGRWERRVDAEPARPFQQAPFDAVHAA